MKNNTREKKLHNQPSNRSHWAYWMQAIEPKSEAINKAFPDFHPQWVQQSQVCKVTPEDFMFLRSLLRMSTRQCAAYLRIDIKTVQNWESGKSAIPFAAFELLRVIYDSVMFKMSHPEWDGWFMSREGRLVSPDVRCSFTPAELNVYSFQRSELPIANNEIKRLRGELDAAISENTRLRQLFLSQGIVDELAGMKDKLDKLMKSVGTAHIVPFPGDEQKKEKAA